MYSFSLCVAKFLKKTWCGFCIPMATCITHLNPWILIYYLFHFEILNEIHYFFWQPLYAYEKPVFVPWLLKLRQLCLKFACSLMWGKGMKSVCFYSAENFKISSRELAPLDFHHEFLAFYIFAALKPWHTTQWEGFHLVLFLILTS